MNTEMVVATTTLTVGKEDGHIRASAKLESVPSSEPQKTGVQNCRNSSVPHALLQPSAPPISSMLK